MSRLDESYFATSLNRDGVNTLQKIRFSESLQHLRKQKQKEKKKLT